MINTFSKINISDESRDNLKSLVLSLDDIINVLQVLLPTLDKTYNEKIQLNQDIVDLNEKISA